MKVMALGLPFFLCGCMGYIPGSQTYWDHRVNQMCGADGGLKVHTVAALTTEELDRIPRDSRGRRYIPREKKVGASPIFLRREETVLNEWNPQVRKDQYMIFRTSDRALLGVHTSYHRIGADVPLTLSHPSSYSCPDPTPSALAIENFVRPIP